ncbi:MAG: M36 family metallopeptidase [Candidatus Ozemobacteraceae bacterium]
MRKLSLFAAACMLLATPAFSFDVSPTQTPSAKPVRMAPVQPSSTVIDAVLADKTIAKGVEMVGFSDDGQTLGSMYGNLSEPLSGDVQSAADKFLRDHAKLFNMPVNKSADAIKLIDAVEAANASHFTYGMNIDGVRVYQAYVDLHVGKDRIVQLANGSFPTIKEISNQISIGRQEALAAAQRAIGVKGLRGTPKAEMVVVPQKDGTGIMAFEVKLPAITPLGDWEILINAETGKEISRLNQMNFADPTEPTPTPSAEPVTGKASLYKSNPLLCEPTTEDLLHMTAEKTLGLFANVINEDTTNATSAEHSFMFNASDTHFDEAQMYYFITQVHDFFGKLGYNKLDRPMKATVHYGDKYDNAYFSPQGNEMCFGDGNKLNDLSQEETVCFHEYSHAMVQQIRPLTYSAESGAINEGQADYFACSLSNDPKLGEWAVKKMGRDSLRNLTDKVIYPKDIQHEVHADGRIWGCVLWDLRIALGAEISDKLVYNSFFFIKSTTPKFADGLTAILAADKNLNAGANKQAILDVFKGRGITPAAGTSVDGTELNTMKTFRAVHQD